MYLKITFMLYFWLLSFTFRSCIFSCLVSHYRFYLKFFSSTFPKCTYGWIFFSISNLYLLLFISTFPHFVSCFLSSLVKNISNLNLQLLSSLFLRCIICIFRFQYILISFLYLEMFSFIFLSCIINVLLLVVYYWFLSTVVLFTYT